MKEVSGRFEIRNKLGMHARAAAEFVQLANKYDAEIKVRKGDTEANGKSIMSVLSLAAGKGSELEIVAEGSDAEEAVAAIMVLIEHNFEVP